LIVRVLQGPPLSVRTYSLLARRQQDSFDPKGDRVKICMTGKFLPFKYYGATGNVLANGLKEE
jgi:hypothetical protein